MTAERPQSTYDEHAVDLLVEIEKYLGTIGPPLDPLIRRCAAIRRALEMHVEHYPPPPSPVVVDLLSRALIEQVRLIVRDSAPVETNLVKLGQHLAERTHGCSG